MKVMLIGQLEGYVSTAAKIALDKGAKVLCFDDTPTALDALRDGKSADIILLDLKCNIESFIKSLKNERFSIPVIACGIAATAEEAAATIRVGAKEYIPFPPIQNLLQRCLRQLPKKITNSSPKILSC